MPDVKPYIYSFTHKNYNVDPVTIEDVGTGFEDSEDYQTEEDFYASNGNESYFWGED